MYRIETYEESINGTGVDLSKILGGQTKILGGKGWLKVRNAWAFLNYWGARARAAPPKVYAYDRWNGGSTMRRLFGIALN